MKTSKKAILGIILSTLVSCTNTNVKDVQNSNNETLNAFGDTSIIIADPVFGEQVEKDEEEAYQWDLFTYSVAYIESGWNDSITSQSGKYVGFLQISKSMVNEANRILGYSCFSFSDRYDRNSSIAIWNVVQNYHNPQHDYKKALKIWNKNHSKNYEEYIMNIFDDLSENGMTCQY